MKTLTLILLLALVSLAGCSADNLVGPDTLSEPAAAPARTSDADGPSITPDSFSITGTWRASDGFGTVTLVLDEDVTPELGTSNATVELDGRGTITPVTNDPVSIFVEVQIQRRTIELALFDTDAKTIAKGRGSFATDLESFKVELFYPDGQERVLVFNRI